MVQNILDTPIEYLKGIGPTRAEMLRKELDVSTFGEFLHYYPFRYVDRSKFYSVREINSDAAWLQLKGKITGMQTIGAGRAARLVMTFRDQTGEIELIWFQGSKWIKEKIAVGREYIIFGKPNLFNGRYNFTHPDIEPAEDEEQLNNEPLQPYYSSSEKLKSRGFTPKNFVRIMRNLISQVHYAIPETLSQSLIKAVKLMPRAEALINIHFPRNPQLLQKAQERIKFDELFFIQLQLLRMKYVRMEKVRGRVFALIGSNFNAFYHQNLPFELTNAQKKVIKEIRADLGSGKQMNRLLQGDVGSGKTLVALMSMLIALDNGCQACLMAPTEILATQHFKTISKMLHGLP
ncbi:MAG: ATP-dependent DNA helicase RecG, partial [Bacteroidetes bacterium HGW-Bacteroidetes-9]